MVQYKVDDKRKLSEIKILFLSNVIDSLYLFRRELIESLLNKGYMVYILSPNSNQTYVDYFQQIGVVYIRCDFDRSSTNVLKDISLLFRCFRILKKVKPKCVLNYTIKPCVYGGLACRLMKIPYIETVTGISPALISPKLVIRKISTFLSRVGYKRASCIFFQNKMNEELFNRLKIKGLKQIVVHGSGVNLKTHCYEDYPIVKNLRFLYLGRIIKAKGIEELCNAIRCVRELYPSQEIDMIFVGSMDENINIFNEMVNSGEITWLGPNDNVHNLIKECHALIMPSYAEGMSNVMMEASACGRPVLASDIPGCKEIFENGVSGYCFKPQNVQSLKDAVAKFISTPNDKKIEMGRNARKRMEECFDRNKIVYAYLREIDKASQLQKDKRGY